jgi:hypothetical protein
MSRRPNTLKGKGIATLIGLAALAGTPGEGRADRIVLRGGGQIRGKVLPDASHPDRVTVLTEKGKTPLVFEKPKVLQVVPEPSALDDYVVKREKVGSTADAQYELGLWCEQHKLADLAGVHYQAALRYDKSFAPAHQKLGHVLYADRWLTQDELREAQGLVRHKGKWVTKEEKEQLEAKAATTAEQKTWVRRLKALREALVFGADDRRRDAEAKLREIKEPAAVKPLVIVFGEDADPLRTLLDTLLGAIPGPEAAKALVSRLLAEPVADVRQNTMEQLGRRSESDVEPLLVKSLRSSNPAVVNRAAWALGNLNVVAAVPKLVPALITTQYRVMMVPSGGSSGGGMGIGASFGSVGPTATMAAPMAYNGSSIAYLTPPAVGPGAVAFGATQVPYASGTSLSLGGGAMSGGSRGPVPRLVPFTFQNVEVLSALTKLTGQDFGYDTDTWKRWVATSFKPDAAPSRRVPQP